MFRSSASSIALGLVLAGCSGLAQKYSDQTPINRTAVLKMHMVNEGIKSFPAFESTTRTYTRATMRRIESTVTGTGTCKPILMNVKWGFAGEALFDGRDDERHR